MQNLMLFTEDRPADLDLTLTYGGKGANLHRMAVEMGLPVPEGFTIPCEWTFAGDDLYPLLDTLVEKKVAELNASVPGDMALGNPKNPMLVSVRSGAPKSMPGMMETILNLGLNDKTVKGLADRTNEAFAWDSYRRFIQMYATIALGMDPAPFNERFEAAMAFAGGTAPTVKMLQLMVKQYKAIVAEAGNKIPTNPADQLRGAIRAVFDSWSATKAVSYRKIEGIPDDLGTAVNVQRMVFGNLNDKSGTGVAFTRDPNTGENVVFGDFLVNAQGEDVVDGSHITMPIQSMSELFPDQWVELNNVLDELENTFKDMCDVEFTIEDGKLFILQTRVGKRGAAAAIRIAAEMLDAKMIDVETCIDRITSVNTPPAAAAPGASLNGTLAATGNGASPGIASGAAVFSSDQAVTAAEAGQDVILITKETNPNDIAGMAASKGILTAKGGLVSHAAVVARGWGIPCVVGCAEVDISPNGVTIGGVKVSLNQQVIIDGTTGEVFL